PANLVMAKGLEIRWNETMSVDGNGALALLLPAGDYTVDGTFNTIESSIEMTYNGGLSAEVVGGGVESPDYVVNFNRRLDHSVSFEVGENYVNITQSPSQSSHFTIIAGTGEEYLVAEIPMVVTYTGNEAVDEYDASVLMDGFDAQYWTVEFYNGTNATGDEQWEITRKYTLGLDNPSETIRLRIIPANLSQAQSYAGGHSLMLKMTNTDGSHSEYELRINVPQLYGFNIISDITGTFGVIPGGEGTYVLEVENTGNGDDMFTFGISDPPEGWTVATANTVPFGPGQNQSFTIFVDSPENSPDVSFSVWLSVGSQDNSTYGPFEIKIKTALPDLEISDWGVIGQSKSGFAAAESDNTFFVVVTNDGDVDAESVVVEILNGSGVVGSATGMVPKDGGEQSFEIIVDTSPYGIGSQDFTLRINTTGFQVVEDPSDVTFKVNIQREAPDEASNWLGLLVLLMFIGILYMFWKFSTGRSSMPF
ncbi:MAG: hypothetical protein VX320_02555, partial [Candidatus Thermoplasmatota archaeon]|nr:hypothetical protein [Candidatus Thermoplasmatota archaeon]MEE3082956.1 hypothetical protein [Candidatus Thermoplasmatota archaeon]